jgi:hypothetical protein
MFVGHEFLAFAIAGGVALRLGYGTQTALHAGLIAALAALLPDLDIGYALGTYAVAVAGGAPLGWEPFWGVANATHRVVTHTLPTGIVAALTFGATVAVGRRTAVADPESPRSWLASTLALAGAAVVGTAVLLSGFRAGVSPAAAVVAAGFLICVGAAGWVLAARTDLPTAGTTAAAGVGFLSHPFGDVLLAVPPPLLSPFGPPVLVERVSLAADPTLHLLGALFVELVAVWAGLAVLSRLGSDRIGGGRLRDAIDRRAGVGVAYAPAAIVLPRPTIADAHILGATIVPLAVVVGAWAEYASFRRGRASDHTGSETRRDEHIFVGVVTTAMALTLAAIAYATVYTIV